MQKLLINLLLLSFIFPFPNNPPNAVTGAPGEGTCRNCHSTYTLNSGSGDVEILGIPDAVIAGETYQLQVKVSHPTLTRWGFEVAAKFSNNTQAGSLEVSDNTHTISGVQNGITYIKQKSAGTYSGQTDVATWEMDWTAPGMITSDITFYAAGMTSNSGSGNSGDYVYATSFSATEGEEIVDVDYETEIQPIFDANCTSYCHSGGGAYTGGLDLSSYENLMLGTSNNGPVVIPGDADGSLLVHALEGTSSIVPQMPANSLSLSSTQIQFIRTWINEMDMETCTVGDYNEDGTINVLDIVQMVNYILGPGNGDEHCGDVNDDGTLNILDVVLIVNIILGN
ncbi:MAG: hypothetical protein H8E72_08725 [Candidatus Marinimicrobia bacterium]|nr:hypothetical protein [Candidatus Neomarinimicrobiota bacterium]